MATTKFEEAVGKFIFQRPFLVRYVVPFCNWYAWKRGYRQMGLRSEDLLPEESEVMQLALKRLPPKEAYDRVFRLRRAFQLSLQHKILPQEQWTPPHEDGFYLSPIVEEIEKEMKEREDLDSLVMQRRETQRAYQRQRKGQRDEEAPSH